MVIVFTGDVPDDTFYPADYIVTRYILPAAGVAYTEPLEIGLDELVVLGIIGIVALVLIRYVMKSRASS